MGSSLISWRNKHQNVASYLSTEDEYRAMASTTLELCWLCDLLCDMDVITPILIHCDNKSVIVIASNPIFHDRTRHIEVNCLITRQE